MATYYISPTTASPAGNNANAGTISAPWATLSYALSQVTTAGDTIYVNAGSYNESTRCVLAPEVSIAGAGSAITTVNFSYAASSYSDGCIYAVSSSITNGNQSISGLTITTSSYTSARGIFTRFRNNFEVHDCVISGFDKSGINAYSSSYSAYSNIDGVITLTDPTVNFTTGLRIYNCTLNDNTEAPDNIGECNLRWSGHSDWEIYNNTFTTTTRVNNRSVYSDNIKNGKFHNNIINTRESISGAWLFALEMYSNFGGNEMYENTFNGGGTIDIAGYSVLKGDYDYSWYVHDNTMTLSTLVPYDDTPTIGITIEGHYRVEGVIVTRNHIKNFPWGITLTMGKPSTIEDIDIYANIIENSASSNTSWASFGIGVIQQSASVIKRNINILNNTIIGNQTYSYRGIIVSVDGTIDDVAVKNNIIQGFDYGIRVDNNSGTIDSLHLVNNLIHDCGTTVYIADGTSSTNYINTGQITTNPSFVSSSDFHLSSISSPAYHAGVNVGLVSDLDGNSWNNPPSIGAYEYTEEDPPIANFTADTTPIYTGDSVEFTDTSTNVPTSWSWNFGDGGTSTQQNPTHTFLTAGTFTITLTSTNDYGSDTETKVNYITVVTPGLVPVSGFIVNDTTAYTGQTIYFTDQSLNTPTSWLWNFGDGNSSINQNPTHSYSTVGIFTVTLIVTNSYGTDTETKVDYIIVTDPNPPEGCLVQIPFMRFFII